MSIRKDIDNGFSFPDKMPLTTTMADFLEKDVDEKFYLSDTYLKYATDSTLEQTEDGNGFKFEPRESESIAKSITSKAGQRMTDNFIKEGVLPVNAHDDGTCRTIKAQYHQTSFANFQYTGTFGATGVVKIDGEQ